MNSIKTILFLHGLESNLSDNKKLLLERFGNVEAQNLDYRSNASVIEDLFHQYDGQNINFIIGSSMGGFVGYHLGQRLNVPALLFNPALPYRSVPQNIPPGVVAHTYPIQFILGVKDDVIAAAETMQYLAQSLPSKSNFFITLRHDLSHRIPYEVFEEEVNLFFQLLYKPNALLK